MRAWREDGGCVGLGAAEMSGVREGGGGFVFC